MDLELKCLHGQTASQRRIRKGAFLMLAAGHFHLRAASPFEAPNMQTQINGEDLLQEDEVANWLTVSKWTLQAWRCRKNDGPAFIKIGSRVRYKRSAVQAYIDTNTTAIQR